MKLTFTVVLLLAHSLVSVTAMPTKRPTNDHAPTGRIHTVSSVRAYQTQKRTDSPAVPNDSACLSFWRSVASNSEMDTALAARCGPPIVEELSLDAAVGMNRILYDVEEAYETLKYLVNDSEWFPTLHHQTVNLQSAVDNYYMILQQVKWTLENTNKSPSVKSIGDFEAFLRVVHSNEMNAIQGELRYLRRQVNAGDEGDENNQHVPMDIGTAKFANTVNRYLRLLLA